MSLRKYPVQSTDATHTDTQTGQQRAGRTRQRFQTVSIASTPHLPVAGHAVHERVGLLYCADRKINFVDVPALNAIETLDSVSVGLQDLFQPLGLLCDDTDVRQNHNGFLARVQVRTNQQYLGDKGLAATTKERSAPEVSGKWSSWARGRNK